MLGRGRDKDGGLLEKFQEDGNKALEELAVRRALAILLDAVAELDEDAAFCLDV